ncbi:WD40 repeat domain-containing protein [Nocardiopsis potens]|uniref:WD40 repeat domain-containing protein n=1 Tax=Nocardiopsis potens TaxID=1246458 RepID=UPI0003675DF9|nr:WD40 repeat domain-containing protein [Nocardiopsis potens]
MTPPFISSRAPSHEICDLDLVTVDGRPLFVCADGGPRVYTWDPSDDRWTEYRLRQPYRPDEFHALYGFLPEEDDDYRITAVCAAVADGRIVVGGGNYEEPFAQWDLHTGAVREHARLDHGGVQTAVSAAPGGRPHFIVGDCSAFPAFLRVWDASRGGGDGDGAAAAEPARCDGHGDSVGGIAAGTLDGRPVLVSGGWDGLVMMWDAGGRTLLREFEPAVSVMGLGLADVDGRTRVVAVGEGEVVLGDPGTGEWQDCIDIAGERPDGDEDDEDDEDDGSAVTCADVGTAAGRPIAVTGSDDGAVHVWSLEERRLLHGPFTEHEGEIRAVRITALDGRTAAVAAGRDGDVHVWHLD